MHDTPHRELFARDVRAFSNGCIRLREAGRARRTSCSPGQVADPAGDLRRPGVAAGKEKAVTLERTIPVHIVYRTVWFDDDGAARYRPDVYGRDAKVFEALEAAGRDFAGCAGLTLPL